MLPRELLGLSLADLIVLCLATYRLSHMMANDWEIGPRGLLSKIRKLFGIRYNAHGEATADPGSAGDMLLCIFCNSVWIGGAFTILYAALVIFGFPAFLLFLPLALSGFTVVVSDSTKHAGG